jgi:hypothetical protein
LSTVDFHSVRVEMRFQLRPCACALSDFDVSTSDEANSIKTSAFHTSKTPGVECRYFNACVHLTHTHARDKGTTTYICSCLPPTTHPTTRRCARTRKRRGLRAQPQNQQQAMNGQADSKAGGQAGGRAGGRAGRAAHAHSHTEAPITLHRHNPPPADKITPHDPGELGGVRTCCPESYIAVPQFILKRLLEYIKRAYRLIRYAPAYVSSTPPSPTK